MLWRWLYMQPTRHSSNDVKIFKEITAPNSSNCSNSANTLTKHKINKLYFTWCDTSCDTFIVKDASIVCFLTQFEWLQHVHIFSCFFILFLIFYLFLYACLSFVCFPLFITKCFLHVDIVRCFCLFWREWTKKKKKKQNQ